jgi:outer membrane protein assembly factor BamA
LQAKVERVIIDGVGRTKDDIVTKQVEQVFEAENFEDVSTCIIT